MATNALSQQKRDDKRTALIKRNILASFGIKGWSALMQFLLVPLTLHCLGAYENGLWLTISSMLLWIDNFDVGLGNGLRNKLAEYLARDEIENAQKVVSSTFFMLIILIVPICLLLVVLISMSNVYGFLNVNNEFVNNLQDVLTLTVLMVSATFIFKFIGNFYLGVQLPAVNNLLVAIGHTLTVISIGALYLTGKGTLMIVALAYTVSPLIVYVFGFLFTFYRRYPRLRPNFRLITKQMVKELLELGVKFFILQIAGIVLFMSSNIIISRLFSPEMVTPYQVSYRYFSIVLVAFTVICVPYWTATTDAYQKGDRDWILRSNATLNKIVALMALLLAIMVVLSGLVYRIWIGSIVTVPFTMTLLIAIYVFILMVSQRYSYILNGFGALNLQLVTTILAALLFITLSSVFGGFTKDINYLFLLMCLVNLPGVVVNFIQYHKILNNKASGIWLK